MRYQNKAFQLSLLIHSAVIFAIFGANALLREPTKRIIINFDLARPHDEPAAIREKPAYQGTLDRKNLLEPKKELPSDRALEPAVGSKEMKEVMPESPEHLPPAAVPASTAPVEIVAGGGHIQEGQSSTGSSVQKAEGSGAESDFRTGAYSGAITHGQGEEPDSRGRTRYLAEQYSYIRDRILRNISYPEAARRMSWQGTVVVSFIVTDKGDVESIKLLHSSGFKILDNDALEAIVNAAPYPKPPVAAQVIIPIVYRLH